MHSTSRRGRRNAIVGLGCVLLGAGGPIAVHGNDFRTRVAIEPESFHARQTVGMEDGPPLAFVLTVGDTILGTGFPDTTYGISSSGGAVIQFELPNRFAPGGDEGRTSGGIRLFDYPRLCAVGDDDCTPNWTVAIEARDGLEGQLALGDIFMDNGQLDPYIIGLHLPPEGRLLPGDVVRFEYHGILPGSATDWCARPFRPHFRYRSFTGGEPGPWKVLRDGDVEPLVIRAHPDPAFVKAVAPLDVVAGDPVDVDIIITDRFGNPYPYTGQVVLEDGVADTLVFDGQWRDQVTVTYAAPGDYRIVPKIPGVRSVYHHSRVHAVEPSVRRFMGDVHVHTGDGGAQRKFNDYFGVGDHRALYSSTQDALTYLEWVAGYDFGAVSEHAARDDAYRLPTDVAQDPEFQLGGACDGTQTVVPGITDWWRQSQLAARDYQRDLAGDFTVFPAYEWHSQHTTGASRAPLHRVVLFRSAVRGGLPILPGDIPNLAPQCLVRFLALSGFFPDRAIVIPHLMRTGSMNIDWDQTYAHSNIAPRYAMEAYHRVGEVFSARSYDQVEPPPLQTLTMFEGRSQGNDPWSFRYGWRNVGAHIGVIAASDNHTQMPGVNDDVRIDGGRYSYNHPAGAAIVLAAEEGRDGIFDAMADRATYATSGIRAWLDFRVDGEPMGSELESSESQVTASVDVMLGMQIQRLQLWATEVGNGAAAYRRLHDVSPDSEKFSATFSLPNPAVGGMNQEWLYYVRVFAEFEDVADGEADEAVWSSPVWVRWSAP